VTCEATVKHEGHIEPCGKLAVKTIEGPLYQPQPVYTVETIGEGRRAIQVRTWKTAPPSRIKIMVCEEHSS
jgi:hypothetical protein